MEEKKKNILIGVLIFIIILLVVSLVYVVVFKNDKASFNGEVEKETVKYENTFKYDENNHLGVGVAYVKGYAKVERKDSCIFEECTEENSGKEFYDIVEFHITNTESADFKKAINDMNNGELGSSIQLGCVIDNVVELYSLADKYYNSSNTGIDDRNLYDNYWGSFSLNEIDTQKLVSSNESNQITLKLEKYPYTMGGGPGVVCYSPINSIEIVN